MATYTVILYPDAEDNQMEMGELKVEAQSYRIEGGALIFLDSAGGIDKAYGPRAWHFVRFESE